MGLRGMHAGKIGIVAMVSCSIGGCASVRTVNGVDLNSPPTDPCHGQVLTCVLVGGVVLGGAALLIAGRSKRTSPNSTGASAGGTTARAVTPNTTSTAPTVSTTAPTVSTTTTTSTITP